MKKLVVSLLVLFVLSGCSDGNETKTTSDINVPAPTSETTKESATVSSSSEEKPIITELNVAGEIKSGDKVMYTIEATEVKDTTDKAKNERTNDDNNLDFYSNGQAKQAVQVTLLMKNSSGDVLGTAYLDNVKVVDQNGISSVGGWKDQGGSKTEFGYYNYDESGNPKPEIYEVADGESKLATSTVLLATPSETLKFTFTSEKYGDSIEFELPITK
ncbi:hypothetical protein [Enterococcus diestrammenae]|uniref:DUF4352 domain-containing protein n=1 Tax=Enterococcus diestrammenae TaxID=1155073 RepID=A0ABV0F5E8_9ENTE|nr:hypothetical protein [Enterococcus diestrammenae]KAF1300023.1 hypothetical protein BAU18_12965 [Enterococcus diestrammenae]